jgi:hypothetical protein
VPATRSTTFWAGSSASVSTSSSNGEANNEIEQ